MTEDEIRLLWQAEREIYEAWADFIKNKITTHLTDVLSDVDVNYFLKLPVIPRSKELKSIVDKALFRDKTYANPYQDITDKVGMRFVVLLSSDIRIVEDAILDLKDWAVSKDRDFEDERRARPLEFAYQSVHYVLRAAAEFKYEDIVIPMSTPCEVQIRTLLQHAHSELTHDTIYKPKKTASPEVKRTIAKSMALIEATDDFFVLAMNELNSASQIEREAMQTLRQIYLDKVGLKPELQKSNLLILDSFKEKLGPDLANRLNAFILEKKYILEKISKRAESKHLFRQPTILLTYLCASLSPAQTKELWPLTPEELRPVFIDLGISFDNY